MKTRKSKDVIGKTVKMMRVQNAAEFDDLQSSLVDAVYTGLPSEMDRHKVDAGFNDDGTVTAIIGSSEFLLTVKRER